MRKGEGKGNVSWCKVGETLGEVARGRQKEILRTEGKHAKARKRMGQQHRPRRRGCYKARANEAARRLCCEPPKITVMVTNHAGRLLTNEVEVR